MKEMKIINGRLPDIISANSIKLRTAKECRRPCTNITADYDVKWTHKLSIKFLGMNKFNGLWFFIILLHSHSKLAQLRHYGLQPLRPTTTTATTNTKTTTAEVKG